MTSYLDPTQDQGRAFFMRDITGPVVMLNLLRFREVADYSDAPHLTPAEPISGKAAYDLYMHATTPFLAASGGEVLFSGKGGDYVIGPTEEHWDYVLLVKQASVQDFMAFASHPEYQAILGHRTAALADSRLLPIEQTG